MAKFSSANYLRGADTMLSQHNFPAVYKNAMIAFALGATPSIYHLCAYHHHNMIQAIITQDLATAGEARAHFLAMYQLSQRLMLNKVFDFTHDYQISFDSSKMPTKIAAYEIAKGYFNHLQAAKMQYKEGTVVDFRTAKQLEDKMTQVEIAVSHQAVEAAKAFEMGAPLPHEYLHLEQTPMHNHHGPMHYPQPHFGQGHLPYPGQIMPPHLGQALPVYPPPGQGYHPQPGPMHYADPNQVQVSLMGQAPNHDGSIVVKKGKSADCVIL